MKKLAPVLAALVLLSAALPIAATEPKPFPREIPPFTADKPLPVPRIVTSRTPDGLTVWLVPRPGFPKVTAVLAVRGGTASDPKGSEGIAEFVADMLKEGTTSRSSRKIAEELQSVGGSIVTNATDDAIFVDVDGLARGTETVLAILADVARHASFPAEEVELVRTNTLQQLQVKESTPEFPVEKAFAAAIFGDHPYRLVAPEPAVIQGATAASLKREYARRFRPEGSLLVVIGAFDEKAALAAVSRLFGGWKMPGDPVAATAPPPGPREREILFVARPGSVQSNVLVGRTGPKISDPDYFPGTVANTIFGGGFASRLVNNIREEKGYTYSPGSSYRTFVSGGQLQTRAAVRNDVTAATLNEIFYEMDRMGTTDVSTEELKSAQRLETGLYLLRTQIQGAMATQLASFWVKGMPPEFLGSYVAKINAVTAAQVREAGRKLFASRLEQVVVGGDPAVKESLGQFGPVRDVKP